MNFYSPVYNTRCHSIGHEMRIARIRIWVDSQGRHLRGQRGRRPPPRKNKKKERKKRKREKKEKKERREL